jgi:hypothetical protein
MHRPTVRLWRNESPDRWSVEERIRQSAQRLFGFRWQHLM